MSNREFDQGSDERDSAFAAVLRRWSSDARVGRLLQAVDAQLLILDNAAATLLYASPAAAALRAAIASRDGSIDPALSIGTSLRHAALGSEQASLTRIQFDRRRVQAPVTCLVARAMCDGEAVIALFLTSLAPRLRPFVESLPSLDAAPLSPGPFQAPPALPQVDQDAEFPADADRPLRFTWRSGADDQIESIAGPAGGIVRSVMTGRSWQALAETRVLTDAEGMLAALSNRRTFRAISLVLRRPGSTVPLELELSGAPLGRAGQTFSGYGGFGLVRRMEAGDPGYDLVPAEDTLVAEPSALVSIADVDRPLPSVHPPSQDAADSDLTGDEHDAFREIARALGVRFAGDVAAREDKTRAGPGGDVMPFPGPIARPPETATAASIEPTWPYGQAMALLELLPAGVVIVRDGVVLFANPHFLAVARYDDAGEIAAAGGFSRLFHGLASTELSRSDRPVLLSRGQGGSLPVSVTRAEIEWEGSPAELLLVNDASAELADGSVAAAGFAHDFAVRRAAATVAILDSLDDAVVTLDAGGRVLSLNRRAASLFALDPREVVGCGVTALFAPESAETILAALSAPLSSGSRQQVVHLRGAQRSPVLTMRLNPLDHGDGDGAVLVLREVRNAGEIGGADILKTAMAASALRSEVLGKISHELRTPLNGILGFTDAMLSEQFGPFENERYRECLHDIRASGEHVLGVIDDLVEIAGIEAGRRDLAFTEVPLNEIVSNCVAMLQPQASRDRIVIRTSFSDNLTRLVADERSVRQAALNVITNALRFTEAGGQVIVSTTMADRGEIALRVRDTGSGMTPDEVEVALKPYSISAMNPAKGGTGLGLPLTKALVEANRGRLRIMSRKHEGTLVEMLFPTTEALSA